MRLPDNFEKYVEKNIIKKCSPDKQRAKFLINESALSMKAVKEHVEKVGIKDSNANLVIKNCYDIIMELVRAKLLLDGYSSSGRFAHEAEVSYLKKLDFLDKDILFLNDLRYFRNSATYYGKILDKGYAEKVFVFLKKIYPILIAKFSSVV